MLINTITDGINWRFYFSQTAGIFSQKCFKTINLLEDELEDIELMFLTFLNKEDIENGNAEKEAKNYLKLSQKKRTMEDSLPDAKRMVNEPPFLSLPECLCELVNKKGFNLTKAEAADFIQYGFKSRTKAIKNQINTEVPLSINHKKLQPQSQDFDYKYTSINQLPNMSHTSVIDGEIAGYTGKNWKRLLENGIRLLLNKGYNKEKIMKEINVNLGESNLDGTKGYKLIKNTNISLQGKAAFPTVSSLFKIAAICNCRLEIKFKWLVNEKVEPKYRNKKALIRFN